MSVGDNLTATVLPKLGALGFVSGKRQAGIVEAQIAELGIVASSGAQPIGELSGGNQQKAMVGRALASDPRVLVLAAPTQGVDIASKDALYRIIEAARQRGMAVLVVSDDLDELAICDRVEVIFRGRLTRGFARGWSDPTGAHARISELAAEGIWLGRLIGDLMPGEPEALGLLALMLHLEARRGARRSTDGDYVALSAQDTALWDHVLIDEAEALLHRAAKMARPGRYQTEAAIQSAHAARRLTGKTDWQAIAALYDVLWAMTGSPVVAINRAMAQAETSGPAVALAELDTLATDARLATYQPYWAGRADLCQRVGDQAAARDAYGRAIGLEHDPAVRRFLQDRLAKLAVN